MDLNKKYFGDNANLTKGIELEWARIPHFYSSFYVFQYATGFSSAAAISKMICNNEKNAIENYFEFLQSGCSDYPLNILRKTGVDLSTPKPIENAMKTFEDALDAIENLM